jgi:hypothetical protein
VTRSLTKPQRDALLALALHGSQPLSAQTRNALIDQGVATWVPFGAVTELQATDDGLREINMFVESPAVNA